MNGGLGAGAVEPLAHEAGLVDLGIGGDHHQVGGGNLLGVGGAVAQKCGLLPHAPEEEPREAECGEEGKIGARRLCLRYFPAHGCGVQIGAAGDDLH